MASCGVIPESTMAPSGASAPPSPRERGSKGLGTIFATMRSKGLLRATPRRAGPSPQVEWTRAARPFRAAAARGAPAGSPSTAQPSPRAPPTRARAAPAAGGAAQKIRPKEEDPPDPERREFAQRCREPVFLGQAFEGDVRLGEAEGPRPPGGPRPEGRPGPGVGAN